MVVAEERGNMVKAEERGNVVRAEEVGEGKGELLLRSVSPPWV